MLSISDEGRVRTLVLNRPEALNAFNEALYDAATEALLEAAAAPNISVVIITGAGRAFSAGNDLKEMQARIVDPGFVDGKYGFRGFMKALKTFPKPLICAVNGLGVGIGATILGFADLAFMSKDARLKCPFTSLGVAPEAASSFLLPQLVGRQNAAWMLMSSEWITADDALAMGLVWRVCAPDRLLAEAVRHAQVLAAKPATSLIAVKQTIVDALAEQIDAAEAREYAQFEKLLGSVANADALADFTAPRD